MAAINFHRQFLVDLVESGDAQLPNRVLKKLFTDAGEFRSDRDDHPYKGIANAWIRVVSRGNTAYRVIYLRERDLITLYRAGPHAVEDNLAAPTSIEGFPVVAQEVLDAALRPLGSNAASQEIAKARDSIEMRDASRFMKNHETRRLYEQIIGRRLIPHREAVLVSPYLTLELLRSTKPLGQMLDEWVADGCSVTLVTRPPTPADISEYSKLESRGFSLLYLQRLHAKAYVFRVDPSKLNKYQQGASDLLLLGSANLTNSGFNPDGIRIKEPQLELSYQVAQEDSDELEGFLSYLAGVSVSHDVVRNNIADQGAV